MQKTSIFSTILALALLFTLITTLPARADLIPGHLDTGFDPGAGANDSLNAVALQPDGKILIGGIFTKVDDTTRNHIARLNADGSLDSGFDTSIGPNSTVYAVAVQPDGKVIIGGLFSTVAGTDRKRIARLNANGSLDTSFNPGTGVNNWIDAVAVQSDGKVLIGGSFTTVNGTSRKYIARLNANGSLDTSFDPGAGPNNRVISLAIQTDGKVLIGGLFTTVDGTDRNRIARLNADGSLDTSLNPGTGADESIHAMAVQTDGKVLIGGYFITVAGTDRKRIARLNANGSLDASFDPGTGANALVSAVALQPDGKVLIGGFFTTVAGTDRKRIARLNANGSLDASFDPGTGANALVSAVALQPDGKILIGGVFTTVDGVTRNRIARLNTDGSLDTGFDTSGGPNSSVEAQALQRDGRVVIGGGFKTVDGTDRKRIARLRPDGSLDSSFNPGTGADGTVYAVTVQQPDGRVIIGGNFTQYNGTGRNRIASLNADGSLFTGFDPGATGANDIVYAVALQPDGKILIGGIFTKVDDTTRNHIARLNADGSLDSDFNPGAGADALVYAVALQPDGKVLIAGNFAAVACTDRYRIARLNADGSLDTSFNPGIEDTPNWSVRSLALQPDGKVLIGGAFFTIEGTSRSYIARLNANGSLDTSFNPGTGANGLVLAIALQPDAKVLIGGTFTTVNNTACNRIARLNADGSVDTVFDTSGGAGAAVLDVAVQPDGKVLIGGSFTTVDGVTRNRIARLNGNRTFYVNKAWDYYGTFPAFTTIQAAVDAAGGGDHVKVRQGTYRQGPVRGTTGMVTVTGGWNATFTAQTGATEMYAPGVTGGGGIRVQPNVRVIAP